MRNRMSYREERRLLRKTTEGCKRSRNKLIEENLWFIYWKAKTYPDWKVPYEARVHECTAALVEAVDTKDLSYSCKLTTYVNAKANVFLLRCCHKYNDEVQVSFRSSYKTCNTDTSRHGLWNEFGSRPSFDDFFEHPNPTAMEAASSCQADVSPKKGWFGHRIVLMEAGGTELVQFIAEEESFEEDAIALVDSESVNKLVEELPERIRYVIRRHFGIAGSSKGTLAEIATELSVSRQRVSQLEKQGLELLRSYMKERFPNSDSSTQ